MGFAHQSHMHMEVYEMEVFTARPTCEDMIAVSDWSLSHLRDIVTCRLKENLHIEFKEGDWLAQPTGKDRGGEFRRQVAAFANADGGILIIGIGEYDGSRSRFPDTAVSLAPVHGFNPKGGLRAWAEQTLRQGVYPALHPFPRIWELSGESDGCSDRNGKFLVVVVDPAEAPLISVRCGARDVFPARIGESAVDLDDWAVRAMLLGTRRQPTVGVGARNSVQMDATREVIAGHEVWVINLHMVIFNEGMTWVEGFRWGLVVPCWPVSRPQMGPGQLLQPRTTPLTPDLRRNIRLVGETVGMPRHVIPGSAQHVDLAPYTGVEVDVEVAIPCEVFDRRIDVFFGLYVLGVNMLPQWFNSVLVFVADDTGIEPARGDVIGVGHERCVPPVEVGLVPDPTQDHRTVI